MTEEEKQKAKQIVDQMFWQPAEGHNYRYRGANRTLTRFYESASMEPDVVRLVINYLRDEEIEGGISLAGRLVDLGTGWKAMDAWYQTSPGDKWEGTESTKVRIYQTLMQSPSDVDAKDGPYTVENGCQYLVTHDFYWNVAAVPSLTPSSSGVSYTLQGVTRDRETGLYSCVVERRERVQQDVALYRSQGSIFQTTSEEQHLGVKQANVGGTGLQQSAGGGVIVTRQIRKNPDCTSDVINERTEEKPVSNAVIVCEKTLRGTRRTVTNRNQASPLSESGLAVGERRTSRKTEGGSYDTEVSTMTAQPAGLIVVECEKDVFQHVHSTVNNQATSPGPDVDEASGGVTRQRTSSKNEDGTFDVRERQTTEKNVPGAVIVIRKTLRGTVESKTDRGASSPLGSSGLAVGETRRSEKTPGGLWNNTVEKETGEGAGKIGETCERQTSVHTHSTVTNQKSEPTPIERTAEPGKVLRRQMQKNEQGTFDVVDTEETHFEKTATATYGTTVSPATIVVKNDTRTGTPSTAPGVNKSVSFDVSPTDRGTFTTREVVTTHNQVSSDTSAGTTVASARIIVRRNDPTPEVSEQPAQNRSVDASVSPNDHGSYDKTIRVTNYSPATTRATSGWATERAQTTVVRHSTSLQVEATNGDASADPDDNGAATTRVTEYIPIPFDSGWLTWTSTTKHESGTYVMKHGMRIFKNLNLPPTPPSGFNANVEAGINKFGLYDGRITYTELVSWTRNTGGGTYGGIQNGSATCWQYKTDAKGKSWKRSVTVATITFYGRGNEGTEAYYQANPTMIAGMHLSGRTYAKGSPSYGNWEAWN